DTIAALIEKGMPQSNAKKLVKHAHKMLKEFTQTNYHNLSKIKKERLIEEISNGADKVFETIRSPLCKNITVHGRQFKIDIFRGNRWDDDWASCVVDIKEELSYYSEEDVETDQEAFDEAMTCIHDELI
ncbi:MAG: hypothetical protein HRT57_09285, partial [Crocinitomicaceae bacterium]|nr:hypothetical protein [Crocinitomicaceae bacterium]